MCDADRFLLLGLGSVLLQEALIEVILSGICGTDLHMINGYYPFTGIMGHEFVGIVKQVNRSGQTPSGEADEITEGKRVVGEINTSCFPPSCRLCVDKNRKTHCLNRDVLGIISRNGSHAQFMVLSLRNLHVVPDSVPNECAVFAEPLAAAMQIQTQVLISPDAKVLVLGAGRLGQLVSWCLASVGADLLVVARHPQQKKLLQERGIPYISALTDEHKDRFDVVVECTGAAEGFAQAVASAMSKGTIVLKSTYPGTPEVAMSTVVVKELSIIGSRCGTLAAALRLMASNKIDPRSLIENIFPLSQGLQAFETASVAGTFKILLAPQKAAKL